MGTHLTVCREISNEDPHDRVKMIFKNPFLCYGYVCVYIHIYIYIYIYTGELGYDGLNGTRKIGPSYAKSVVYI